MWWNKAKGSKASWSQNPEQLNTHKQDLDEPDWANHRHFIVRRQLSKTDWSGGGGGGGGASFSLRTDQPSFILEEINIINHYVDKNHACSLTPNIHIIT